MEGRIVTVCERALTTTVNDIEHTESESYQGVSVIRVFFQSQVKVELVISKSQRWFKPSAVRCIDAGILNYLL